jgi:cytochrome c553
MIMKDKSHKSISCVDFHERLELPPSLLFSETTLALGSLNFHLKKRYLEGAGVRKKQTNKALKLKLKIQKRQQSESQDRRPREGKVCNCCHKLQGKEKENPRASLLL